MTKLDEQMAARRDWMSVLAKAKPGDLADLWSMAELDPDHSVLRAPEIGSVMVRGRAGAVGAAFNLGEMTITRASIRLGDGTVGHAYVQGRDKTHALRAALVDALMQTAQAPEIGRAILAPLRGKQAEVRVRRAAKAVATKVDFFTMERGHA